jgi:membrane-associated protease RseP (regulator of RpoE activity)
MDILFLILISIFLLATTVLVHELGHFWAARLFGIAVDEVSIGFGPVLHRIRGEKATLTVRSWPIGGFVSISKGWNNSAAATDASSIRFFDHRSAVFVAGPVVSFIFGLAVFFCLPDKNGHFFSWANAMHGVSDSLHKLFEVFNVLLFSAGRDTSRTLLELIKDIDPRQLFYLFGMFNVNLAMLNLLPIPPILDGGHLIVAAVENATGKPVSDKTLDVWRTCIAVVLLLCMCIEGIRGCARYFGS